MSYKNILSILFITLTISSCNKLIDVDIPKNMLEESLVFNSNSTANAAVAGMYASIANKTSFNSGFTLFMGTSADEMYYTADKPNYNQFTANNIATVNNSDNYTLWSDPYAVIYQANAIIEGLSGTSNVADSLKKQYIGEAKFIRAFCHFYLTNMYGKIPLITSTDVTVNALAPRAGIDEVYAQIIKDLTDAENTLTTDYKYSPAAGDRTRVNKFAAAALLARVYLYREQWDLAASEASTVINNTALYSLVTDIAANSPFFKNSTEAIWQFYSYISVTSGYSNEGSILKPAFTTSTAVYAVTDTLLHSFETGDKRRTNWITTYTVILDGGSNTYNILNKYRFNTAANATAAGKLEGYTLLRLSEQYLIRAEALAHLGTDLTTAASDLNAVRTRAGLAETTAADQPALLAAIAKERQVELFAEMGHRWMDLKRTRTADAVLSVLKPTTWQSTDVLYPVPEEASKTNSNLLPQNSGY